MTYAATVLADTPLAYWRMGDSSGTTMADSSGNAHPSTYTGSPTLGVTGALSGDANTAVTFNGTTQYGSQGNAAWQNVSNLTIEAWVKTSSSSMQAIIDRDAQSIDPRVFQFRQNAAGKLEFVRIMNSAGATAVVTATGATSINNGAWRHVAATYDGTSLRLYVDGSLDSTTAISGGLYQPATVTGVAVGVNFSSSGGAIFFAGSIDEVAYYGTALSGTRIAAHYTAGTVSGSAASGSASLALTASGGGAPGGSSGTASLTLTASSSTGGSTGATGAAAITLTASAGAAGSATSTATLTLTASESAPNAAGGTATLTLTAGGAAVALFTTDLSNAFDGLDVVCTATVTLTRPPAPVPPTLVQAVRYEKAVPYRAPVMVGGRPT